MPDPLDPSKYYILTPKAKKLIIFGVAISLLLFVPPLARLYYNFAINRPSQTDKEITFEIKNGSSVGQIATNLYNQGGINSKALFLLYLFVNRYDQNIQAGVYKIRAGINIKEVAEMFQHGKDDISVTFIEGWRVEEYARKAAQLYPNLRYEDFVEAARTYEGYLFPDTYYFNRNVTMEEMIDRLKKNFDDRTEDILTDENLSKVKLTKNEVVILASIVEREVSDARDRPVVAGILLSRLQSGTLLGADATVQYAIAAKRAGCDLPTEGICPKDDFAANIDWWPKELSLDDLSYDSPYNTRKSPGLPPSPISSVGLSALEAVINFKSSSYNYYLTDNEGITHFSQSLEEHNQNIRKYLPR